MSRVLNVPVEVSIHGNRIERIKWRERWWRVREVIDHWREAGYWWCGESERDFFMLDVGMVIVVYRIVATNSWVLYRIMD